VGNVVPFSDLEATLRSPHTCPLPYRRRGGNTWIPWNLTSSLHPSMPLEPMPMLLDKEAARQAALNAECIRLILLDTPGMPQFDTLNKDLLKAWCKHNNIRGVSSKSKNELRDMCLMKLRKKVEAPRPM
ncbi:hypothetical protein QJQ45_022909, partial [Haematococcus lacustris]